MLTALAGAILLPASTAAADGPVMATDKMQSAEAKVLRDINRIRKRNGRKPLRLDKRTSHVARSRSLDMAGKRYFAHTEPDGDDAEDILDRRSISAAEVTENIGHTVGLTLRAGSRRMADWWYHSPPHRRQMLARNVNYVGIGIARHGSRFTYTAIFTRSKDKTSPRVVIDDAEWKPAEIGSKVVIDFHGIEPELQTGTAGIKRFEVQTRTSLGEWSVVDGDAQTPQRSFRTFVTGDQHFRVRAVDKAGNVGPWSYTRVDIPTPRPNLV